MSLYGRYIVHRYLLHLFHFFFSFFITCYGSMADWSWSLLAIVCHLLLFISSSLSFLYSDMCSSFVVWQTCRVNKCYNEFSLLCSIFLFHFSSSFLHFAFIYSLGLHVCCLQQKSFSFLQLYPTVQQTCRGSIIAIVYFFHFSISFILLSSFTADS